MNLIEKRTFQLENNEYEIQVVADKDGYKVTVVHNGKRATPYTYCVDFITDSNLKYTQGFRGYQHLMDIAESDVKEKRREKYLETERRLLDGKK